jgi:hypothetical protein
MKSRVCYIPLFIFVLMIATSTLFGNSDSDIARDHPTPPPTRTVAPYYQDFNGSWPPEGWWGSIMTPTSPGSVGWLQDENLWACCLFFPGNFGEVANLHSPWITIPDYMYRVDFKWSHGLHPLHPSDAGELIVSSYGSDTEEVIWSRAYGDFNSNDGASDSGPGTGVQESLDLTRYAGQTIIFLFRGASGYGPCWFVDNFNVHYVDTSINTYPSAQNFSGATFPPGNWRSPSSSTIWRRSGVNGYGASGQGSAVSWDNMPSGAEADLDTPFLASLPNGGTLTFDHAYAHYFYSEPAFKELQVLYSTDGGNSFQIAANYSGDAGGTLVTAPPTTSEFVPSASQWATKTVILPVGTNLVRFRDINQYGAGYLYLDNITFIKNDFPGGNGTESNPYQITNFEELNLVRNYLGTASTRYYFKLMNDIDATPTLTTSWVPIGNNSAYFFGGFDGDNHTISNLRCSTYGIYHGLFGITGAGSTIRNLNLSSTCYFLGDSNTGSIAGHNKGNILNCTSAASVNIGNADIGGGLVGNNNVATISNCRFTGTITRSGSTVTCNKLGGIAGLNETGATVENCYSDGSVAGNTWCGGVVGWNNGTVSRCHSAGTITGASNTQGGLVGQNNGSINNSYSRATVSGAQYVGGLVGYCNPGSVTNSYSTGTVSGSIRGGLCGASGGSVTGSYWDTQTSGIATSYGGTGKTTTQMNTLSTYVGWDFIGETANGSNDYWNMATTQNGSYPFLFYENSTICFPPALVSPANNTTGLPKTGFTITWAPTALAVQPVSYTLSLCYRNPAGLFQPEYLDSHTFYGITGTSYNPVTQGGMTFPYPYTSDDWWYWTVQEVFPGETVIQSETVCRFRIQDDPAVLICPGSYLLQDFSSTTFPPAGWTLNPSVNPTWTRHEVNGWGNAGSGSAKADFAYFSAGVVIDLTMPLFNIFDYNARLSFDEAYASRVGQNDQLMILYSTDFGATFNTLVTYNGGAGGEMVTAPPTMDIFVPTAGQWATKFVELPSGTNMLRFRAISAYGNNLYLDNIRVECVLFENGNGTESDPYQAASAEDILKIDSYYGGPSATDKHFKLMNDLDLSEICATTHGDGNGWYPLCSSNGGFYGTFDGNGKTLSGLWANRSTSAAGLFSVIQSTAVVKDLGIIIDSTRAFIGGWSTAGLALFNEGSVSGCYVIGNIQGAEDTGGLVGFNDGSITNCYTRGTVSGDAYLGGLVGENYGPITGCYSLSAVNGTTYVGGLVGVSDAELVNCYARGEVEGTNYVGGLIGVNSSGVHSCYATGAVSSTGARGGITADNYGAVADSYWDTQTTGCATSSGSAPAFGKTTAEMRTQSTYTGWDFTTDWRIHPAVNDGYPQLAGFYVMPTPNAPTGIHIARGTAPGTIVITWDDMQAQWYGIWMGASLDNITYLGYTLNNSYTLDASTLTRGYFRVTSGSGEAPTRNMLMLK